MNWWNFSGLMTLITVVWGSSRPMYKLKDWLGDWGFSLGLLLFAVIPIWFVIFALDYIQKYKEQINWLEETREDMREEIHEYEQKINELEEILKDKH